jgi:hypothetical protein
MNTNSRVTGWEAEYGDLRGLEIWTVYRHPEDYPDDYIARLWYGKVPTNKIIQAKTLEDLRALIVRMPGMVCLKASRGDDPIIVETWI